MPRRKEYDESELQWVDVQGDQLGYLYGKERRYLTDYSILTLFVTPHQTLWVGGWFGAVAFRKQIRVEELAVGLPRFAWFRDQLWSTDQGMQLLRQDSGGWQAIPVPFQHSRELAATSSGVMFVAPREGLWYTSDGMHWNLCPPPFESSLVDQFWIDGEDTIWIATDGSRRLYHYRWRENQVIAIPFPTWGRAGASRKQIIAAIPDRVGGLWARIDGLGLGHWDGSQWHRTARGEGYCLSGLMEDPYDFCYDQQGRLWAATAHGLHVYTEGQWQYVRLVRDDPTNKRVILFGRNGEFWSHRIIVDHDGKLWVGTNFGEVLWADTTQPLVRHPYDYPFEFELFEKLPLETL